MQSPSRRWLIPTLLVLLWAALAAAWLLPAPFLVGWALPALVATILLSSIYPQIGSFGPVVVRGPVDGHRVALTFDDGPDPQWTPAVLDALAAADAHATFFVVGERLDEAPDLAARIVAEGHQLAHHSHTHRWELMFVRRRLVADYDRCSDAIARIAGHPRCYRPPVGLVAPEVIDLVRARGARLIGWTVRPYDTQTDDPALLRRTIESKVRGGSIVLLHDGDLKGRGRPVVVDALPGILEDLKAKGLQPVTVSELLDEPAYFGDAPVRETPRWSKLPIAVLSTLLALLITGIGQAVAAEPLPPELEAAAQALSVNKTVTSTFKQTKTSILFAEDVVQTGTLLLRREDGRLVWRYDDGPAVLMAGGRFYPAGVTADEAGAEAAAGFSLPGSGTMIDVFEAMFSLQAEALGKAFSATTKDPTHFVLTPRDDATKALFMRVELEVGGTPAALRSVVMDEATGDKTTIVFTDVKIDAPLDKDAFLTPAERSAP